MNPVDPESPSFISEASASALFPDGIFGLRGKEGLTTRSAERKTLT